MTASSRSLLFGLAAVGAVLFVIGLLTGHAWLWALGGIAFGVAMIMNFWVRPDPARAVRHDERDQRRAERDRRRGE